MSTLTIRLPDDKHARLRQLAKHRQVSVNKLVEELATRGSAKEGLAILDKLDSL